MCQTLFSIPAKVLGWPVFGWGLLLSVWALAGVGVAVYLVRRHGLSAETLNQLGMYALCGAALSFLPQWFDLVAGGQLDIHGYGVLLLVAVSSAVGLSARRARQVGQDPEMIFSLGTWLFVGGIFGARMFYVIEYWSRFQKPTLGETIKSMLNIAQGGLVVYGSLLAGGLALFIFCRKYRLPALALADVIVPGLVLGMSLGRIGCFMNGCCYGGLSDLPWAVQFPREAPPFIDQLRSGRLIIEDLKFNGHGDDPPVIAGVEADSAPATAGLKAGDKIIGINGQPVHTLDEALIALMHFESDFHGEAVRVRIEGNPRAFVWAPTPVPQHSLAVHPAQLYSAIDAMLLCLFLLAYSPFHRRDGELLAMAMTIHPVSRFLLEIVRVDEPAMFRTTLSISQLISVGILIGAGALWAYIYSRPAKLVWGQAEAATA
jgi:phosphatidylglycerol:prolipoprotein diacylglycerol transferase